MGLYTNSLQQDPTQAFPDSSEQAARIAQYQRLMAQVAARPGNLTAGSLPKVGGSDGPLSALGLSSNPFQAPGVRRPVARPQPAPMPELPRAEQAQVPETNDIEEGEKAAVKQFGPKPESPAAAALAKAEAALRGLREPLDLSDIELPRKASKQAMTPLQGPDTGAEDPNAATAKPAPSAKEFIAANREHALRVSKATGIDPRLVLAQSALETGWGQATPGNAHFGIKGGSGPALATQEAGPDGKLYSTSARFRSYKDAGESFDDYGRFLQQNSRYAPVLRAKGLHDQIEAMGKSGYATDPNYTLKLHAIADQIPEFEEPTS